MARWAWLVCVVVVTGLVAANPALADEVTLKNGDVLHGDVRQEGSRVKVQSPVLGELDLDQADVLKITRAASPEPKPEPVPAAVVASTARRVVPSCAPCTPCPEAEEADPCKSPWDFAIGFGISNETGNTEKFGLNADLEAGWVRGPHEFRWRINSFYEEAQGVQTEGKYFSNLKYFRRISPRGRIFGLWLVDRDDFADINIRTGWFVGYEHAFIQREKTTFRGAIGAGAIVEDRSNVPTFETAALMAQLEYKHEFANGDSFRAYYYIIPYLDNTELSPSRLELQYAHPLRDHLDLTVGFLADYVPDPPNDLDPLDTKLTFGIRWKK